MKQSSKHFWALAAIACLTLVIASVVLLFSDSIQPESVATKPTPAKSEQPLVKQVKFTREKPARLPDIDSRQGTARTGQMTEPREAALAVLKRDIPGVQVQDRGNPSQDSRLAIRGFGARSAFGVRGVRVG